MWWRLLEDDERETAKLLDVDPARLHPLLSTVRIVCVLDPAVLAHADLRLLYVGSIGKYHVWRHLKPPDVRGGPAAPPAHVGGDAGVEVGGLCASRPSWRSWFLRASGTPRGVHVLPWILFGSARQHSAYLLWYKQPPGSPGPSPEVLKTRAEDHELPPLFAGLLDGGWQCGGAPLGDQAGEPRGGGANGQPAGRAGPVPNRLGLSPRLPGTTRFGGG